MLMPPERKNHCLISKISGEFLNKVFIERWK